MSKCDCCNNEIRVFDTEHTCKLNNQSFNLCNDCLTKINKFTKGEMKSSDIISAETNMRLANALLMIEQSNPNGGQDSINKIKSTGLGFIGAAMFLIFFLCIFIGVIAFFENPVIGISLVISGILIGSIAKIIELLTDIRDKL